MAKKFGMKGAGSTGGLPVYRKMNESLSGGNALESDHSRTRANGRGPLPGIAIARHATIKPSSSSGTIGSGQPLKTNKGGKEQRTSDNPIRRQTKSTKPKG